MTIDYRQEIRVLIEDCRRDVSEGATIEEIRARLLPERLKRGLRQMSPQNFLEWIEEDREYSFFYYEARADRVCAKPAEAVALILEKIILDDLESR